MTMEDYNETMAMFEQMRAQGWNPRVCDTPVPYYENKVPCGVLQARARGGNEGGKIKVLCKKGVKT